MVLIVDRVEMEYGNLYHPNDLDPHFCRLLNYLLTELLTWPIGSGSFTVAAWKKSVSAGWPLALSDKFQSRELLFSSRNGE